MGGMLLEDGMMCGEGRVEKSLVYRWYGRVLESGKFVLGRIWL